LKNLTGQYISAIRLGWQTTPAKSLVMQGGENKSMSQNFDFALCDRRMGQTLVTPQAWPGVYLFELSTFEIATTEPLSFNKAFCAACMAFHQVEFVQVCLEADVGKIFLCRTGLNQVLV
jgi:hypothetical protein